MPRIHIHLTLEIKNGATVAIKYIDEITDSMKQPRRLLELKGYDNVG
jgi:hypothetical protein